MKDSTSNRLCSAFREALRRARRSPRLSVAVVLCVAPGLAATASVVTLISLTTFRALPFRDAERPVRIWNTESGGEQRDSLAWRDHLVVEVTGDPAGHAGRRKQVLAHFGPACSAMNGREAMLVAVARALVSRPRLILADEPTGALQSSQGEMTMELLAELDAEGNTIVQVTHNEAFAARGKRVASLLDGCLVC